MGASFERDGWDGGIQPSVSKDKWVRFAIQKMERGYVMILSDERKSACFFMSGKGYEGCSFKVARQMILDGLLVESGAHPLGKIYVLDADALARLSQPAPKTPLHVKTRFQADPEVRGTSRQSRSGEMDGDDASAPREAPDSFE
jgi:hypothetical protein